MERLIICLIFTLNRQSSLMKLKAERIYQFYRASSSSLTKKLKVHVFYLLSVRSERDYFIW